MTEFLPATDHISAPAQRSPLAQLYHAARAYVLGLDHPGKADVDACLPADPGPEHAISPQENAVIDRWLAPALAALAKDDPALAGVIGAAAPHLRWITYDRYPPAEIGPAFATGHAYAGIRGEAAPFLGRDMDLGCFLIAPHVLYRDHHHAAPELYAPMTGPHGWRFGPDSALIQKPAHMPVWNPSHHPHLTKVGAVPFLCFFVWTRDIRHAAQVIPADDWRMLEQTPLRDLGAIAPV